MKRTYQPNKRRKSKKLGFMARMKTKIVNSRRRKGRKGFRGGRNNRNANNAPKKAEGGN